MYEQMLMQQKRAWGTNVIRYLSILIILQFEAGLISDG